LGFLGTGDAPDNTGSQLMYYRNRMYHAELGRFVSRDPIGYEGSKWNLYEYANSNAPAVVDFDGKLAVVVTAAIIAGGCAVGAAVIATYDNGCDPGDMKSIDAEYVCWTKDCDCEGEKAWEMRSCKIVLKCRDRWWPWPNVWEEYSNACDFMWGKKCPD
jgi:RHS repeat-associated protein